MIEEYKKITETPFLQWLSTNELAPSLYLARDTVFEGHFFVEALGKEHGGLLLWLAYCVQKGSEGRGRQTFGSINSGTLKSTAFLLIT